LVNTVKPDLVLFVGEALVGNDGIDQLLKFNQALSELSNEKNPRLIDGIILTKFDTIDDKVRCETVFFSRIYASFSYRLEPPFRWSILRDSQLYS